MNPIKFISDKVTVKASSEYPYVNSRLSIMIGKGTLENLNAKIPGTGLQFKENDKFDITVDENRRIILTPRQ